MLGAPFTAFAAIAYDNSTIYLPGSVQNFSTSYTTTGSNIELNVVVANFTDSANTSPACTYNGVSMTNQGFVGTSGGGAAETGFTLLNAASGANTLACTTSTAKNYWVFVASYTGVDTSAGIDSAVMKADTGSKTASMPFPVTSSVSGDWGVVLNATGHAPSIGANLNAQRQNNGNAIIADSNASLGSAGSYNLTITQSSDWWYGGMGVALKAAAIAPVSAPLPPLFQLILGWW
jgi:hypothetical protein